MADEPNPEDRVKILPPDRTLQKKLGTANLDQILSPQAVEVAQQVIVRSSDQFLEESVAEVKKLEITAQNLGASPDKNRQALREIVASTFSLKAKAGLGGYDLISMLAKSCHQYCELLGDANVTPANLLIVKWYVESLKRLLDMKVKGLGGPVGEAILAELKKLDVNADQPGAGDMD